MPWSVQLTRLTKVAMARSFPPAGTRNRWRHRTPGGSPEASSCLGSGPFALAARWLSEQPINLLHQLAVAASLVGRRRLLVRGSRRAAQDDPRELVHGPCGRRLSI